MRYLPLTGHLAHMAMGVIITIGLLSVTPFVNTASAGGASGDYDRAVTCKQMRRDGSVQWHSIASGLVRTGGGHNGYRGFVTKACHTNEASCRRWVQNVAHEIRNLDTIETAYCKKVR